MIPELNDAGLDNLVESASAIVDAAVAGWLSAPVAITLIMIGLAAVAWYVGEVVA